MDPIKLVGDSVKFELPGGKTFELPMPTALYDIQDLAEDGFRKAQAETEKAQDEADKAGTDKPAPQTYTNRDWLADVIEYIREKTANNGTAEGIEITEAQASQISRELLVIDTEAKKKLQARVADTQM